MIIITVEVDLQMWVKVSMRMLQAAVVQNYIQADQITREFTLSQIKCPKVSSLQPKDVSVSVIFYTSLSVVPFSRCWLSSSGPPSWLQSGG